MWLKTVSLTVLTMLAFAGNSLFARAALRDGDMDAASFTAVRLAAGALVLYWLARRRPVRQRLRAAGLPAVMLFAYAACFSFAYLWLTAATGALILFSAVQLTMVAAALRVGDRPAPVAWAGAALAFGGLVYLVFPGLQAPSPAGALLMGLSGVAWGIYTLCGKGGGDPLTSTAANFAVAAPLALILALPLAGSWHVTAFGAAMAIASGALASGVGYALWYAVLPRLSRMRAATVQLSVPAIAGAGGVLFLAEPVTLRLAVAAAAILGGIALTFVPHRRPPPAPGDRSR